MESQYYPAGGRRLGDGHLLMLVKIALTILLLWFAVGVVGLTLPRKQLRPNLLSGATWFLCGILVCYVWAT